MAAGASEHFPRCRDWAGVAAALRAAEIPEKFNASGASQKCRYTKSDIFAGVLSSCAPRFDSGVIISGGHLIKLPSPVPANDSGAGLSLGGGEAFSSPLGGEEEGEGRCRLLTATFNHARSIQRD